MRYHSFTRSSEEAKISSEIAKNNTNITNDQKAKLNAKCQNALKIAKDAEKDYINLLNYANNNRDFYIENTKKILNEFQSLEESFIEFVKDILKYHNFDRNNLFTNLQTNHEANLKVI
jgi:hypothetical protein